MIFLDYNISTESIQCNTLFSIHFSQHSNTGTSNTTSWLKSGIDVEKKDTTTTTTSDPKNVWPQDKIPDMSILKFDPKKIDRS